MPGVYAKVAVIDKGRMQQLYNAWCRKPRPGDQVREVGEG